MVVNMMMIMVLVLEYLIAYMLCFTGARVARFLD